MFVTVTQTVIEAGWTWYAKYLVIRNIKLQSEYNCRISETCSPCQLLYLQIVFTFATLQIKLRALGLLIEQLTALIDKVSADMNQYVLNVDL